MFHIYVEMTEIVQIYSHTFKTSLEIKEFYCHSILREINVDKIWVPKVVTFTVIETLEFDFR